MASARFTQATAAEADGGEERALPKDAEDGAAAWSGGGSQCWRSTSAAAVGLGDALAAAPWGSDEMGKDWDVLASAMEAIE